MDEYCLGVQVCSICEGLGFSQVPFVVIARLKSLEFLWLLSFDLFSFFLLLWLVYPLIEKTIKIMRPMTIIVDVLTLVWLVTLICKLTRFSLLPSFITSPGESSSSLWTLLTFVGHSTMMVMTPIKMMEIAPVMMALVLYEVISLKFVLWKVAAP